MKKIAIAIAAAAAAIGYMGKLTADECASASQLARDKLTVAGRKNSPDVGVVTTPVKGREVIVRRNFCHSGTPMLGIASMTIGTGVRRDADGNLAFDIIPVIYTDTDFETLSPDARAFIMSHEMGHIDNGDLEASNDSAATATGDRVYSQEIAADIYAAEIVGIDAAVRGIDELIHYFSRPGITIKYLGGTFPCVRELKRRRGDILAHFERK